MAPWSGVTLPQVSPCCVARVDFPPSLENAGLPELWNSAPLREMRQNMLQERPSNPCRKCYSEEAHGRQSFRQTMNERFPHHWEAVAETRPDGSLAQLNLPYVNVAFSNHCNFACLYCDITKSSGWYADHVRLYGKPEFPPFTDVRAAEGVWERLEPLIPALEHVYFTGGEPLLSPVHYRLLDRLVQLGRTDVILEYNTNFSTLAYDGWDAFQLWRNFPNVVIKASLDAMGRRGEYIRRGQKWDQVMRDRERMLRECSHARFYLNPTLTLLNAWALPDFHQDWITRGFVAASDIHVNTLFEPEEYTTQVLPQSLKARIAEKCEAHVGWLKSRCGEAGGSVIHFTSLQSIMNSADRSDLLPKFRERTARLDAIRGTDFAEVFPELKELAA